MEDFIKETLNWVNRERAHRFQLPALEDLPKGRAGSACDCPIARAFNAEAVSLSAGVIIDWWARDENFDLPVYAAEFVAAFDHGMLPEYVER